MQKRWGKHSSSITRIRSTAPFGTFSSKRRQLRAPHPSRSQGEAIAARGGKPVSGRELRETRRPHGESPKKGCAHRKRRKERSPAHSHGGGALGRLRRWGYREAAVG